MTNRRFDALIRGMAANASDDQMYGAVRSDAGPAFIIRSLTKVQERVQETLYSELMAQKVFPVRVGDGAGLEEIEYYREDKTGEAKLIGPKSNDLPNADTNMTQVSHDVGNYGVAYGWSQIELEKALRSGLPLSERKAMAARKAAEQMIDKVALSDGDSNNARIKGLFGHSGLQDATSGLTKNWASATETQILDDVATILKSAYDGTNGEIAPDSLLLPPAEYGLLAYTVRGNTDTTLLEIVQQKMGVSVYRSARLESMTSTVSSISAKNVAVAFKKDPMIMELVIPRPFQQLPVTQEGVYYKVPCLLDFAGMFCYLPISISFGELT